MKIISIFSIAFMLLFDLAAASKIYLRSSNQELCIDAEGIKFNNMKSAKANPVSFPEATSSFAEKHPPKTCYLYNINSLWRYDQTLGRWFAPGGSMIFARIKFPIPDDFKIRYPSRPNDITKEDFQDWCKFSEVKLSGDADLLPWLESFAECSLKKDEGFSSKSNKVLIAHYTCTDGSKELFTLTDPDNAGRRYLMLFEFDMKTDIKKSTKSSPAIASSASFFTPKASPDINDKKLVTKKSATIKERSPEYIASRDKVISEIKNLNGWWYVETENYIFAANIKNRKLIDEIQVNLEKCRSVYEKYFEQKEAIQAISVVKSFETRDDFLKYINAPKDYPYISMWNNSQEELVISPPTWNRSKKDNRERMGRFIMHEAFHQYMFYAAKMVTASPWFNDGFSTLSEGLEFKKNDFDICPVGFRLTRFNRSGGISKKTLEELINTQYGSSGDRDFWFDLNCRAWALMYFLCKGAAVMDKKEYTLIPFKYYDEICCRRDPVKASEEAWKGIDLDAFARDMSSFYSSKKFMAKAEKYDIMKNKDFLEKNKKAETE